MPTQSSPTSRGESATTRNAIGITLLSGALSTPLWVFLGPGNPLTAMMITFCTANLVLAVIPLALLIPARFYHVRPRERWLHRLLGVPAFGWLLDRSGWNRKVALALRQLAISRDTLPRLLTTIHGTEGAHAIAFLPHMALATLAYRTGHPWGTFWMMLSGIVLHLYPVMLQRWMTLRVAPLVRRAGRSA